MVKSIIKFSKNQILFRTFSLSVCLFLGFCLPSVLCQDTNLDYKEILVDKIVAIVNKEPILHSEIENKIKKGLMYVSYYPASDKDSEYHKVIQDQINFILIKHAMSDVDMDVSDEEVDSEINSFLSTRGISQKDLEYFLAQQNMSYEDYKEDFANQILLRKFQSYFIYPRVKITDKDIELYYIKKTGSSADKIFVRLRQIFIAFNAHTTDVSSDVNMKVMEVYKKLQNGFNFSELAKMYSDDKNSSQNGGLMPFVKLSDLSSVIKDKIFKLSIGEYTEPIRVSNGYYIFYLEEKSFLGGDDFIKQKNKYEMELRNIQMIVEIQKWLAEQRKKISILILE